MIEQMNNGLNNLDEYLKSVLDSYQAEPSTHLWGKVNSKLLKKDVSEFVRFKKLKQSFSSQHTNLAMQVKIWVSYAAAACLAVGLVYGSTVVISNLVDKTTLKTEEKVVPVNDNKQQVNVANQEIDNSQQPSVANLPLVTNHNKANTIQQKDTVVSDNKVKDNNNIVSQQAAANNTVVGQNNTVANNVNALVNYIHRLNQDNKVVSSAKTEDKTEDIQTMIHDNTPADRDTTENANDNQEYKIEIPNVITPNGDGFNDVLIIKNLDKFVDNSIMIADRSGKVVYEKNSYQNDWEAQNLADGTYYYILTYKNKNNSKGVIKGMITVIRK